MITTQKNPKEEERSNEEREYDEWWRAKAGNGRLWRVLIFWLVKGDNVTQFCQSKCKNCQKIYEKAQWNISQHTTIPQQMRGSWGKQGKNEYKEWWWTLVAMIFGLAGGIKEQSLEKPSLKELSQQAEPQGGVPQGANKKKQSEQNRAKETKKPSKQNQAKETNQQSKPIRWAGCVQRGKEGKYGQDDGMELWNCREQRSCRNQQLQLVLDAVFMLSSA